MTHDNDEKDQGIPVKIFLLGRVQITPAALELIPDSEIRRALDRHHAMDWGVVCSEDWKRNDEALTHGGRVVSVYKTETGETFWLITEWDRTQTTILLPSDY
jgi:hypothetical protein